MRTAFLVMGLGIVLVQCSEPPPTRLRHAPDEEPDGPVPVDGVVKDVAEDRGEEAFDVPQPDPGQFGARCTSNNECASGLCIEGPEGYVCSRPCIEQCPEGWQCRKAVIGAEAMDVCILPGAELCKPCQVDEQCGHGACMEVGQGRFCGRDCSDDLPCPQGYECRTVAVGEHDMLQCVPSSGTCDCTVPANGKTRPCQQANDAGVCTGVEVCKAGSGWAGCTAPMPMAEICNGKDDDCDGVTDEDARRPDEACMQVVEGVGKCPCQWVCNGEAGFGKAGPLPAPEVCNYLDDDCDGLTDEDFRNAAGAYADVAHCGGCGRACPDIAFATGVRCDATRNPPTCVVEGCEPGYYQVSDLACAPIPDLLCTPCKADSDCQVPLDRCLATADGKTYCLWSCSEASAHPPIAGGRCPAGYECLETESGAFCFPASTTCDCLPSNDGEARVCVKANELGTCHGQETCSALTGWSECSAPTPVPEVCNDQDDDCNGVTDDPFASKGKPCLAGTGVCQRFGVFVCDPSGTDVVCSAEPGEGGEEVCNYQDDDCDGLTDEDFTKDGLYVSDNACGNCFTDCTSMWSSAMHHAAGRCVITPSGKPGCTFECEAGFVDADRLPGNGCELELDQDALYVSVPENGGEDKDGCGSWDDPCATIGYGVATAAQTGRTKVFVSEGLYAEDLVMVPGISVLGGFAAGTWVRDPARNRTIITGADNDIARTVVAQGISAPTELSGFTIWGKNPPAGKPGEAGKSTYAVWVKDCSSAFVFADNVVYAGRGSAGGHGLNGAQGQNGGPGMPGSDGRDVPHPCAGQNPGGASGESACGVSGGAGGSNRCPAASTQQQSGEAGSGEGAGGGGAGGFDAWVSGYYQGLPNCGIATMGGHQPSAKDGDDGLPGANGTGGKGCLVPEGLLEGEDWLPGQGAQGAPGTPGGGGGGGGAGGSVLVVEQCNTIDTFGGAGGGGGAGGCGGSGGGGGPGGGGSFALFVLRTPEGPDTAPVVIRSVFVRNSGGDGGQGGSGGQGGVAGVGGQGGNPSGTYKWASGKGGHGGAGGNGGHGGGGGGGCGGVSFGIYAYGYGVPGGDVGIPVNWCHYTSTNSFSKAGSAGKGGQGGTSNGSPGGPGADGAEGDCLLLPW